MKRKQPLPSTPLSAPYWDAVNQKKLLTQICLDCDSVVFYPRYVCPHCLSENLNWKELPGTGTIYSYSSVTYHVDPAIAQRLPMTLALIDLDEGPRVVSNIVGVSLEALEVGAKVKVSWEACEKEDGSDGYLPVYELDI